MRSKNCARTTEVNDMWLLSIIAGALLLALGLGVAYLLQWAVVVVGLLLVALFKTLTGG